MAFIFLEDNRVEVDYCMWNYQRSNGPHRGIDIDTIGDPTIHSTVNGAAEFAGKITDKSDLTWQWGTHVRIIEEGTGYRHIFAHCLDGSLKVSKDDRVSVGQALAIMGKTGNAEDDPQAEHVHYQVDMGSIATHMDPTPWCSIPNETGTYYEGGGTKPGEPDDGKDNGGEKFPDDPGEDLGDVGTKPGGGDDGKPGDGTKPHNPYTPPPPSGGANPTDADMQAAYYAVSVAQDNIAIAEAQRAAAYDYLQQARYFHPIALQMKAEAEQRLRNTEPKVDALITKNNNDIKEIDDWIGTRLEGIRSEISGKINDYVVWLTDTLKAVENRLLSFFSPVTGKTGEMQVAFEDLFELHRGDALTAVEYDAVES